MKAPFDFVIEPKGNRYNNTKKVGDKDLILNTEVYNHQFVNRSAIVKSVPTAFETDIKPGDEVIVHHNVFRRWHDVRGKEKRSSSYINEDHNSCSIDQIYAVFTKGNWEPLPEYVFVAPVKNTEKISNNKEKDLFGILKINNEALLNKGVQYNDLVSFTPSSEFEFILNDQKLYRIKIKDITATYGYSKNEIEYNPSWRKSG